MHNVQQPRAVHTDGSRLGGRRAGAESAINTLGALSHREAPIGARPPSSLIHCALLYARICTTASASVVLILAPLPLPGTGQRAEVLCGGRELHARG